jgi:hypothetical protein
MSYEMSFELLVCIHVCISNFEDEIFIRREGCYTRDMIRGFYKLNYTND